MDELLFNQIIQSHEIEAELCFENEMCKLRSDDLTKAKANNYNVKRCKFQCLKCQKLFSTNSGFHKHMVKRRIPCNKIIDQNVYISRHIYILCQKYKELRLIAISDFSDDDFKKRMLISIYKKANEMLKICEENIEYIPDGDNILYSIKVMIQNMETGNYDNMDLS